MTLCMSADTVYNHYMVHNDYAIHWVFSFDHLFGYSSK